MYHTQTGILLLFLQGCCLELPSGFKPWKVSQSSPAIFFLNSACPSSFTRINPVWQSTTRHVSVSVCETVRNISSTCWERNELSSILWLSETTCSRLELSLSQWSASMTSRLTPRWIASWLSASLEVDSMLLDRSHESSSEVFVDNRSLLLLLVDT